MFDGKNILTEISKYLLITIALLSALELYRATLSPLRPILLVSGCSLLIVGLDKKKTDVPITILGILLAFGSFLNTGGRSCM